MTPREQMEAAIEYEESDRQKVFDAARGLGCEVIIAQEDELQLDIDRNWCKALDNTAASQQAIEKKGAAIHWTLRKIIGQKL